MPMTFPLTYMKTFDALMQSEDVTFSCRGMKMWKEFVAYQSVIVVRNERIGVFSHRSHRVTPIRFVLAELCWILAGRFDLKSIASYNKAMLHYSDDDENIHGSYGLRLDGQLSTIVDRLHADIFTRQACAAIFDRTDCLYTDKTHMPCNVFLQFLYRPSGLCLHVTSRSSDFATGFSIDTIHWQALLIMVANELTSRLGEVIVPSKIYYNLGSLHVYAADRDVMTQWVVYDRAAPAIETYGYDLTLRLGLTDAIQRAKDYFKEDLSVEELGDILMLDDMSMINVNTMHKIFLAHRNKLVR